MTETELLVDCLRRLETAGIEYMLVGSMVGNYWGVPRSTHEVTLLDQDAWIAAAEDVLLYKLRWHTISPTDRQLTDARGIQLVSGDDLDRDYLMHWAQQIGVVELLQSVLDG